MSNTRPLKRAKVDLNAVPANAAKYLDTVAGLALNRVCHKACAKHEDKNKATFADKYICACCRGTGNYWCEGGCHETVLSGPCTDDVHIATLVEFRVQNDGSLVKGADDNNRAGVQTRKDGYTLEGLCFACIEHVESIYDTVRFYMSNFGHFAFYELVACLLPDLCRIIVDYGRLGKTRQCLYCVKF
jgi:hypothetical protein